nr:unnamed protein product [Spirometra erinaceieuropaei]
MDSFQCLQINPKTWKDLADNRSAQRSATRTWEAIYEDNRVGAAKFKRELCKSRALLTGNANPQQVRVAKEHPACGLASSDISGLNAPTSQQPPTAASRSLPLQPPQCPRRRSPSSPMISISVAVRHQQLYHPSYNLRDDDGDHHSFYSRYRSKLFQQPVNHNFYHSHSHLQRCGLHPKLSSLRLQIHLTRRSGR